MDVACEGFNLGTVVVDKLWVSAFQFWDEFGDIVNLSVVKNSRTNLLEAVSQFYNLNCFKQIYKRKYLLEDQLACSHCNHHFQDQLYT